jgi:hypothetical protein
LRTTIADHMFFHEIQLAKVTPQSCPILEGKNKEYLDIVERLVSSGCNRKSLLHVLDLGARLRLNSGHSIPKARRIKKLVVRMWRLAKDTHAVERTQFLSLLDREEMDKWYAETKTEPEDVKDTSRTFPFLILPWWMLVRHSMYKKCLKLASQNALPKNYDLTRLGCMCVALYVEYSTRKTHFPEVSALLAYTNFGRWNAIRLSRETRQFETGCPLSCGLLTLKFAMLDSDPLRDPNDLLNSRNLKAFLQVTNSERPKGKGPKDHASYKRRGKHSRVSKKRRG